MFNQWCKDCGATHGPFNKVCTECGCEEFLFDPPANQHPRRHRPATKVQPVSFNLKNQGEGQSQDKGAQLRYKERQKKISFIKLSPWWVLHNCVAHPLIGVLPFKPLFQFHDWTARKIGSEILSESL